VQNAKIYSCRSTVISLSTYVNIETINILVIVIFKPGGGGDSFISKGGDALLGGKNRGVKIKGLVSFRVSKYINMNFSNNNSSKSIKI